VVYLIVFIVVILAVLWGTSIYFVKTGKLSAQDWSMKSLGLPQGSVRALLAFLLLFSLVFSILTGTTIPDLPDWMVGILGTVIGFYFGAAMAPKAPAQPPKPEESTTAEPR
jgi:predicted lysophospholipase L1 biosynthesis ABC-type transport system permease subunit